MNKLLNAILMYTLIGPRIFVVPDGDAGGSEGLPRLPDEDDSGEDIDDGDEDDSEEDEDEDEDAETDGDDGDDSEQDDDDADDGEEDSDNGNQADSLVDIDLDGEEFTVPKKIADSIMKSKDYTQKTQELGERRRALDSEEEKFQKVTQLHQENMQTVAKLTNVNERIAEYDSVDWQRLNHENPQLAQQHQVNLNNLERERDKLTKELNQKAHEALAQQQAEYRQRNQQAKQQLEKEVKGYSHETHGRKAMEMAKQLGYSDKFIKALNTGMFPDAVPMIKTLLAAAELNDIKAKVAKAKKPEKKTVVANKKVSKKGKRFNIYNPKLTPEERIKYWQDKGKK